MEQRVKKNREKIFATVMALPMLFLLFWFYKVIFYYEFSYHDDLLTLTQVQHLSIIEIFQSTIIDSFYYRPVIQLIIKAAYELFAEPVYAVRTCQILLHISTLALFYQICRKQKIGSMATYLGMLSLTFAPFTYVGVTKYGIEIGTYLLGCIFMYSLLRIVEKRLDLFMASLLTVTALLTREQGLLIAFMCFLYFFSRKDIKASLTMVMMVLIYLSIRTLIIGQIGSDGFVGSSGWFVDFLTVSEIEGKFASNPFLFYLYNITCHLISLIIYLPVKGQYIIKGPVVLWFICCQLFTFLVIVNYVRNSKTLRYHSRLQNIILLSLIVSNAVIAYSYCRYRMLFIAGLSMSVLLSYGTDTLMEKNQQSKSTLVLALLLCLLWCGTGVMQLKKLELKSIKLRQHYLVEAEALPGVDPVLYSNIRTRLMNR